MFKKTPSQKTVDLVWIASLITLWSTLSLFFIQLRFLIGEGFIPVFYFLVWLNGLILKPKAAFFTCFFGHFCFDLIVFFNPLFIFVWTASGLSALLISLFKKYKKCLSLMVFIMPGIYFLLFWAMGSVYFYEAIKKHPLHYFGAFPIIFVMLVFVNPIFNFIVYRWFIRNPSLINLRNLLIRNENEGSRRNNFLPKKKLIQN